MIGCDELKYAELAATFKTKICETERLLVRPYQDSDEDGLLELFRDENTMRMDGWRSSNFGEKRRICSQNQFSQRRSTDLVFLGRKMQP